MAEEKTGPANPPQAEAGPMSEDQAIDLVTQMMEPEGPAVEAKPKPEAPPVNQDEEPEAEAPEAEAEVEADAEGEPSEAEESDESEPDDDDAIELPSSIGELAQALEMDVAEVTKMKVPIKIHGQESEVTLGEAIEGYQRDSDYRSKTMELAEQRRTFEAEQQGKTAELQQNWQETANLATLLHQRLGNQYSSEQLDRILQEEGAEAYLQAKQKADADREALGAVQHQQQKLAHEAAQKQQQFRGQQQAMLKEKAPEFADAEKLPVIERQMSDYLRTEGFSDEDVSGFFNGPFDHRQVLIVRNAMKYAEMKNGKAKEITKRVKAKPKLVKPGTAKDSRKADDSNVTALRSRLKKASGRGKRESEDAAIALVRGLIE